MPSSCFLHNIRFFLPINFFFLKLFLSSLHVYFFFCELISSSIVICGFMELGFTIRFCCSHVVYVFGFYIIVTTPLWDKCDDETHTPKSGKLESSGTPENSELEFKGQTPCIEVLFISMKRS
jgi:hypothetical protein